MVEKKLNFNQPILSVRKYSSKGGSHIVDRREGLAIIHWLPPRKPVPNSGPVTNPGFVPFQWEQSPGRPKEEILAQLVSLRETSDASSATAVDEGDDLRANTLVIQRDEERRRIVDQEKAIVLHCGPSFEREGSDRHENVITVCCLLPRSRLKSSICGLSRVPAMRRVMTFPGSRMLSESAVYGSSTDSESEHAVVQASKLHESDEQRQEPFLEEKPGKQSFRTLQELLADDAVRIVEREEDDVKTSSEMKMTEDSGSDSDQVSSSEDDIRLAVNKAAENARKRLATEGAATTPPQPPLPASPSDSWLSRMLPPTSTRKASSSFMSRFSNK